MACLKALSEVYTGLLVTCIAMKNHLSFLELAAEAETKLSKVAGIFFHHCLDKFQNINTVLITDFHTVTAAS